MVDQIKVILWQWNMIRLKIADVYFMSGVGTLVFA